MEQLLTAYRQSLADVQKEQAQREQIMASDAYRNAQAKIEELQALQEGMLSAVPDSREEHDADKQALMQWMQDNTLTTAGEFHAKTRAIRSVDVRGVLEAMQGDIDNLMLVSSVKQKDIEEFWKANPEYRKSLKACIREEGYRITDLYVPEA